MEFRHLRNQLLAMTLAVGALTGVGFSPAQATDFAPVSIEQTVDASTYVIRGTVEKVWAEQGERGQVWTRAQIAVTDTLKGHAPAQLVIDSMGGTVGDVRASVWGAARFSVGEDVFVFVEQLDNGRLSAFGMFNGKYTIRRAARDTQLHAMKWQGHPDEPFDHRFLPYPKPAQRLYLDDLVRQVKQRVSTGWDGKPVPGVSTETLRKLNVTVTGGLQ
jgi:hypothetical protein